MDAYDMLFPGGDLDKPITSSAANLYIRRIRDGLPIEDWRTHDFRRHYPQAYQN